MNKSFTLEEYKKNPSRLVHADGTPRRSQLIFEDTGIAIKDGVGQTFVYNINKVPSCYVLGTEYEVRRSRPWRFEYGDSTITLGPPPKYPASPWVFCGPEFEYKVEKP